MLHKPGSGEPIVERVRSGRADQVNFVPNWIGHSKNSPEYRFMATISRLERLTFEQPLPAMEGQMKMPFHPRWSCPAGSTGVGSTPGTVFGVVTNRTTSTCGR